jgi:hypothetical protein
MVRALSLGVKWQKDEVELFSPLSSAQVMNAGSFNFTLSICFHDMELGKKTSFFPFQLYNKKNEKHIPC